MITLNGGAGSKGRMAYSCTYFSMKPVDSSMFLFYASKVVYTAQNSTCHEVSLKNEREESLPFKGNSSFSNSM